MEQSGKSSVLHQLVLQVRKVFKDLQVRKVKLVRKVLQVSLAQLGQFQLRLVQPAQLVQKV
jgi:hypothetical protein